MSFIVWLAYICKICPICQYRRKNPNTNFSKFWKKVEVVCPFCWAYNKQYGGKQ